MVPPQFAPVAGIIDDTVKASNIDIPIDTVEGGNIIVSVADAPVAVANVVANPIVSVGAASGAATNVAVAAVVTIAAVAPTNAVCQAVVSVKKSSRVLIFIILMCHDHQTIQPLYS